MNNTIQPLASTLRPTNLGDIVGQEKALDRLKTWLKKSYLPSIILWGPPGCGKTTLAPLLAKQLGYPYISLSAIFSGVQDLKKVFETASTTHAMTGDPTVLFVDEIHRFNKAQQDAFLPVIENGTVVLLGATTENPSFNLNNALLSRCQVVTLEPLTQRHLIKIYERAVQERYINFELNHAALQYLAHESQGDGRYFIQMLEILSTLEDANTQPLSKEQTVQLLTKRAAHYDKGQDQHYNLISALHKSVRSSDVDASLYWMGRMLQGGEDPRYILRRLIRMAIEDIGLASPQALSIALDSAKAYERLGSPEGDIALTQCVIYLASSPKSNSVDAAHIKAMTLAKDTSHLAPPPNIVNAPTKLMKNLGYGRDYQYDHKKPSHVASQPLWPQGIQQQIYTPGDWGFEETIKARLKDIEHRRKQ